MSAFLYNFGSKKYFPRGKIKQFSPLMRKFALCLCVKHTHFKNESFIVPDKMFQQNPLEFAIFFGIFENSHHSFWNFKNMANFETFHWNIKHKPLKFCKGRRQQ